MALDNTIILRGRDAVIRYNPTTVAFPTTDGTISDAAITAWGDASLESQEVVDLEWSVQPEFVEITPREYAKNQVRQYDEISRSISLTMSIPHYGSGNTTVGDGEGGQVDRFSHFMQTKIMAGQTIIGLMILEKTVSGSTGAGVLGNFRFGANKTEMLRGVQAWQLTGVADGLFVYRENIPVLTPAGP